MQTKELIAKLSSENEVLEALIQIRQEVCSNENMLTNLTQLLPAIPTILEIAKTTKNEQMRFEALFTAFCFTQSETESEMQYLVDAGFIPVFCNSIAAEASEDILRVCCMTLHNLACESITRRDQIINFGVLKKLAGLLITDVHRRMSYKVIEKVTLAVSTLMSMKPTPELQHVHDVIPALRTRISYYIDDESNILQAFKRIANGSKEHVEAVIDLSYIPTVLSYLSSGVPVLQKPALSIVTKASFIKNLATELVARGMLRDIVRPHLVIYKPCIILRNVASFCDDMLTLLRVLEAKNCISMLMITIQRKVETNDTKKEQAREYAVEALYHLVRFANSKQIQNLIKYELVESLCYVIVHDEPSTMLYNAVETLYLVIKQIPRAEYLYVIDVAARERLDSLGIGDGDRKLALMCRRVMDEAGFPIVTLFKGTHSNSASSCTRSFLDIHIQIDHHSKKKRKRDEEVQQAEEDEQPSKVLRSLPMS